MAHRGTCVDSTHKGVLSTPWGNFFITHGGCLYALDPWGSPSMILYFTGDLVDDLTQGEVSSVTSNSLRGAFNAFHSLGDVLRVFMSFTQLRVFLSFWCILEFSFPFSTFWEPFRNI